MGKLNFLTYAYKAGAKLLHVAERNPKATEKIASAGASLATKAMYVGGIFGAWQYLKKNGGIVNEGGSAILGEDVNKKVRTAVADKFDGKDDAKEQTQAGQAQGQIMSQGGYQMEQSAPMVAQNPAASPVDGVQNFMGSMTGSNGSSPTNMMNNFVSNLFSGGVPTSNIAGLMLGAWMMFRMSIWGKLGGALLSMMMVGKNSQQQMPTQQMQPGMAQGIGMTQQPTMDVADGFGMRR